MQNEIYQQWMAMLNPEQAIAVNQLQGAVMVLAGPGTGKTQLVATRIAHMLAEGYAEPENILCLTYTNAGVKAMRERLSRVISTDAWRVQIHTFHSWCKNIIDAHPERFNARDGDVVTELEMLEMAEKILQKLPAGHLLFKESKDLYAPHLVHLHSVMVQENWSKADIQKAYDAYFAAMKNDPKMVYKKATKNGGVQYIAGDYMQPKENTQRAKYDKLLAGAALISQLEDVIAAKSIYTFGMMQQWVLAEMQADDAFRAELQEQHQVLFVDEFQDTSGTQYALLQQLMQGISKPDICAVGDDDQSIYRFQGASVANIHTFLAEAENPVVVSLEQNYRSSQQILNAAEGLIKNNADRMSNDGALVAKNETFAECSLPPVVVECNSKTEEVGWVTEQIEKLLAAQTDPNEIAVLYLKHSYSEDLQHIFVQKEWAFQLQKEVNILRDNFVQKIIQLLECLTRAQNVQTIPDGQLFQLLCHDWWGLPDGILPDILIANEARRRDDDLTKSEKTMWQTLKQMPEVEHVTQTIEHLSQVVASEKAEVAFRMILTEAKVNQSIIMSDDPKWRFDCLQTLLSHLQESTKRNQNRTIAEWIKQLKTMTEHQLQLRRERLIGTGNGITLSTLHGAKGLEFEHVFIIGSDEKSWNRTNHLNKFSFLPNLVSGAVEKTPEDEKRRLMYVGVTRAKKGLSLTYDNAAGKRSSCPFAKELLDSGGQIAECKIQHKTLETIQRLLLQPAFVPQAEMFDTQKATMLLAKKGLSPSAVNTYINCPTQYYYSYVMGVPENDRYNLAYGDAVHKTLEWTFGQLRKTKKSPTDEMIRTVFETKMTPHRSAFTTEQWQKYLKRGAENVPWFVKTTIQDGRYNGTFELEKQLEGEVSGVRMKGSADMILTTDAGAQIIDFKTSAPDTKMSPDNARQLLIYRIIFGRNALKGVIAHTKPNTKTAEKQVQWNEIEYEKGAIDLAQADVMGVIEGIQKGIFFVDKKCKNESRYSSCLWCDMRKEMSSKLIKRDD